MSTDTEPQTEHRYTHPETPAEPEPDEPRRHRAVRAPETPTALVLRAVAWAALWWVAAFQLCVLLDQGHAWAAGIPFSALAVLQVVTTHRRRAS